MPTIRVDDDVFAGLQKIAKPFTDTPNSVIKRLLEEAGVMPMGKVLREAAASAKSSEPSARGKLVPQPMYEKYLLYVLAHEFNGKGHKHEVSKAVIDRMERRGLLSDLEHKMMQTGETRAENTIAWGRNALKERGLLSANSPRGVWELTEAGKDEGLRTEI
jgi:hypothetical protein